LRKRMRAKNREESKEKGRGVREKGRGVRSASRLPRERRKVAATGWSKQARTLPRCFMDHLIHGRWQVLHLYDSLCRCICPPHRLSIASTASSLSASTSSSLSASTSVAHYASTYDGLIHRRDGRYVSMGVDEMGVDEMGVCGSMIRWEYGSMMPAACTCASTSLLTATTCFST
jgi:hypothetical protein